MKRPQTAHLDAWINDLSLTTRQLADAKLEYLEQEKYIDHLEQAQEVKEVSYVQSRQCDHDFKNVANQEGVYQCTKCACFPEQPKQEPKDQEVKEVCLSKTVENDNQDSLMFQNDKQEPKEQMSAEELNEWAAKFEVAESDRDRKELLTEFAANNQKELPTPTEYHDFFLGGYKAGFEANLNFPTMALAKFIKQRV